jgi:hypothetical protein
MRCSRYYAPTLRLAGAISHVRDVFTPSVHTPVLTMAPEEATKMTLPIDPAFLNTMIETLAGAWPGGSVEDRRHAARAALKAPKPGHCACRGGGHDRDGTTPRRRHAGRAAPAQLSSSLSQ